MNQEKKIFRGSKRASLLALLLCCSTVLSGCTDEEDEEKAGAPAAIPEKSDNGFVLGKNSFSFPNFTAGYPASKFNADMMVRMFGEDKVCVGGKIPCVLTPMGIEWMASVNSAMQGGRCEGFAVLSQAMFLGLTPAGSFGAGQAASLSLQDNQALQQEIAYWFGTQFLPSVVKPVTQALYGREALAFLGQALQPGKKDAYRLGLVNVQNGQAVAGHAVTPIGIDRVNDTTFEIRIYDNNFPQEERRIKVDTSLDRWEYAASTNPSEATMLYQGDRSNKNRMYLTATTPRVGVLPCTFCEGGGGQVDVLNTGPIEVKAKDESGAESGFAEGEPKEGIAGSSVLPGFNQDDTSARTPPPISLVLPGTGKITYSISGKPSVPGGEGVPSELKGFGEGLAYGFVGMTIPVGTTDTAEVSQGGSSTVYNNTSRTGLVSLVALARGDGSYLWARVTVPPGSSKVEVSVDKVTGQVTVAVESEGEIPIDIDIDRRSADLTELFSMTRASSGSERLTLRTDEWQGQNASMPVEIFDKKTSTSTTESIFSKNAAPCQNGKKDEEETGVDCGGACAPCPAGQACLVDADCQSATCGVTGLCAASFCEDGKKNGGEADVDCGGSCPTKCKAGQACFLSADCASNACNLELGVCVEVGCTDGLLNGSETDVDCGGPCDPCENTLSCVVGADCKSGVCSALTKKCAGNPCVDEVKGQEETDVDCGGSQCAPCAPGLQCQVDTDCQSSACTSGVCEEFAGAGGAAGSGGAAGQGGAAGAGGSGGSAFKLVFVSSQLYDGNLGGLVGADAKCQSLASAAGLVGTFKAWLSDTNTSAASRLTQHSGPYQRVDGVVVADSWSDLTDGALKAPIRKDEKGNEGPTAGNSLLALQSLNTGVWTFTKVDGERFTTAADPFFKPPCNDWTSTMGSWTAQGGDFTVTDGFWTQHGNVAVPDWCAEKAALYCFEQ